MSDWTPELKQEVIDAYKAANPTSENSMEIVKELAERFEKSPNGVRLILSKAEVYKKKAPGSASTGTTPAAGDKPKRVSKSDAIAELTSAIKDAGQEPDEEILVKLTGKAAQYFSGMFRAISVSADSSED